MLEKIEIRMPTATRSKSYEVSTADASGLESGPSEHDSVASVVERVSSLLAGAEPEQ